MGAGGGKVFELCDEVSYVSGNEIGRIQEYHISAGHGLIEYIEDCLIEEKIYLFTTMDIEKIDALIFDFDGVLTDNKVYVCQNGTESVCCNRADGLAFDVFKKIGLPVYILSTESNPVVAARGKKLGVNVIQGSNNKVASLKRLCNDKNYNKAKVFFVGNDLNDLLVMKECGYSACPFDAHTKIQAISDFTLKTKGGQGVAREILEQILGIDLSDYFFLNKKLNKLL